MLSVISSFSGEYRWLSNFYPSPQTEHGLTFPTNEHYYQACKATNIADAQFVLMHDSPGGAKKAGRAIKCRADWESVKLGAMRKGLILKFTQNPLLLQKLRETAGIMLVEGNTWGDRYWGVCKGVGENHLGKMLMQLRQEL